MLASCRNWLSFVYRSFSACTPRIAESYKACIPIALTSNKRGAEFNAQGETGGSRNHGGHEGESTSEGTQHQHSAPVSESVRKPLSIIMRNPEYLFGETSIPEDMEESSDESSKESKFQFRNVHDRTKVRVGAKFISLDPEEMFAAEFEKAVEDHFDEQMLDGKTTVYLKNGDENMSMTFLRIILSKVNICVEDKKQPMPLDLCLVSCYIDHRFFTLLRTSMSGLTRLEIRLNDDCRLNLRTQAHWEEVRKCFLSLDLTCVVVSGSVDDLVVQYSLSLYFNNLMELNQPAAAEAIEGDLFIEHEGQTEEDPTIIRAKEPVSWISVERINNEWQITNIPLLLLAAEVEMIRKGSEVLPGLNIWCNLSNAFMKRLVHEFSIWPKQGSLSDMVNDWMLHRHPTIPTILSVDTKSRQHERAAYERTLKLCVETVNLACILIQVAAFGSGTSNCLNFLEELRRVVPRMLPFELIFTHRAEDWSPRIVELEKEILTVLEWGKSNECRSLMAMASVKTCGLEAAQASCMLKMMPIGILRNLREFLYCNTLAKAEESH